MSSIIAFASASRRSEPTQVVYPCGRRSHCGHLPHMKPKGGDQRESNQGNLSPMVGPTPKSYRTQIKPEIGDRGALNPCCLSHELPNLYKDPSPCPFCHQTEPLPSKSTSHHRLTNWQPSELGRLVEEHHQAAGTPFCC
jgi:hypothetical protein